MDPDAPAPGDPLSAARRALAEGENFRAYDLAEAVPDGPGGPSPEKTHLMALALARSGSGLRARELAATLPDGDDTEIAGLRSRLFKDLARVAFDPEERRRCFAAAADASERVFAAKGNWYNGINAASCRLLAGDRDRALRLVREKVLPLCEAEPARDLWLVATLGECRLLLGDFDEAAALYHEAAAMADAEGRLGDLASTLRQLRLLADAVGPGAARVLAGLDLPCVAVFSGHRIDDPGRPSPRFPPAAEEGVRRRLRGIVRSRRVAFGYASCACGGDILFLEEVLDAGGRVVVAPPLPLEKAVARSVATAPGDWEARLRAVLAHPKATLLEAECDETGEDDAVVYSFCNRHLFGLAMLKARELGFPLRGVCVWDGRRGATPGGTSSAVQRWRMAEIPVDVVPPREGT